MLSSSSVGHNFLDSSGNSINIFKKCTTCCTGIRYYGCIENDTSDNFFAYNLLGQRLDHKGKVSKDTTLHLILE